MANPAPSPEQEKRGAVPLRQETAGRGVMRWLPGLVTLRGYEPSWLRHDLVAGLVLTTMLVPVGIAYAVASGLPGVYGLYATIVPLLVYALFGPSRILVLGPDSSLAPIILAVVLPLSAGDPMRAVALAGAMAIVSGLICIVAGVMRLGFITELLSKPIRYGYMNGIALTVLISQLPKLLGFSVESDGPLRSLWAIGEAVWNGSTNWTAFCLGAAALATILLLKGSKRLPGVLIAVIGATLVAGVLDLSGKAGVAVLGSLPEGLPAFSIPWIGYRRPRAGADRRCGGGPGVVRRHKRSFPRLRRAPWPPCGSQPGNGGTGRRQSRRRILPGLSDQQQRVPHPGGGSGRRKDPGDRHHRRPGRRRAAGCRSRSPAPLADSGARRRRHRLGDRPGRGGRPPPDLSHSALGVLAVDRLFRRRGGAGRDPRNWPGHRDRRHRVPVGWLAAALRRSWSRRRRQGLSRHHPLSRRAPGPRPGAVPLGCAAVFRQCRVFPGQGPSGGGRLAHPGAPRGDRRRAGHQRRRDVGRRVGRTGRQVGGGRHRDVLCRAQGSGQGQAEALRSLRTVRREVLFSDHRRSRRCLSQDVQCRLGRSGKIGAADAEARR